MFWKLGIVEQLLSGKDGDVCPTMVWVSVTDKRPRCSVKHLIPLEVRKELD